MSLGRLVVGFLAALWAVVPAHAAEPFVIHTAIIPPYITLAQGGKGEGLIVEIMTGALTAAGLPYRVADAIPWRRAQTEAMDEANSLVSPFARTPVREPDWIWVANLLDEKMYIYVPAGAAGPNNAEELAKVRSLGVLAGGAPESIAKELHLEAVAQAVPGEAQNAMKTAEKRIDAWMSQGYMAAAGMRDAGIEAARIDRRFVFRDLPLWVATSKKTSPEAVAQLQTAFKAFLASPAYQDLLKRYQ